MSEVNLNNDGRGTTDFELMKHAKRLKLRGFKGVFMRNELTGTPANHECGIVNLESSHQEGSHWVAYFKNGNEKYYIDAFGARPPKEIVRYLKSPILYSTYEIQQFNSTNCGEWVLYFHNKLNKGEDFIDAVLETIEKHEIY